MYMVVPDRYKRTYIGNVWEKETLEKWKDSRMKHGFPTQQIDTKLLNHQPVLVFLDTKEGIALVAEAIANDHPVVTDYGSTYGTAFSLKIRREIAHIRREQEPLPIVSLVCAKEQALKWMNKSEIHQDILESINNSDSLSNLDIISGISFIRFKCTQEAREELGEYYVNKDNEVQVFIVDDDPLMKYLADHYDIHYIAVRSSNITGNPEEPFKSGAEKYASEIGAPIIAVRNKVALQAQLEDEELVSTQQIDEGMKRKRMGSQPILTFKKEYIDGEEKAVVELVRAGNTSQETIQRLLNNFLQGGKILFRYNEVKPVGWRKEFNVDPAITDPQEIKKIILEATLIS